MAAKETAAAGKDGEKAGEDRIAKLEANVKALEKVVNEAANAAECEIAKGNMMMIRWDALQRFGAEAELTSRAQGGVSSERGHNGYALLGGIRRVRLVVGDDLRNLAPSLTHKRGAYMVEPKIITFMTQAREIVYLASESESVVASLQLQGKVSDFVGGLDLADIKSLEVQLKLDASRVQKLSNNAYLKTPLVYVRSVPGLKQAPNDPSLTSVEWNRVAADVNAAFQSGNSQTKRAGSQMKGYLAPPLSLADLQKWITVHAVTTNYKALPSPKEPKERSEPRTPPRTQSTGRLSIQQNDTQEMPVNGTATAVTGITAIESRHGSNLVILFQGAEVYRNGVTRQDAVNVSLNASLNRNEAEQPDTAVWYITFAQIPETSADMSFRVGNRSISIKLRDGQAAGEGVSLSGNSLRVAMDLPSINTLPNTGDVATLDLSADMRVFGSAEMVHITLESVEIVKKDIAAGG